MLEQVLYEHLQSHDVLNSYLAQYNNRLAIFNQEAPNDMDFNWGDSQYNRIVFNLNLNDDSERHIGGSLILDIFCENNKTLPEEIEIVVKSILDGYFFSCSLGTFAFDWDSSNYFTEPPSKIIGVTLIFVILAFPYQFTDNPDPIDLMNKWTKENYEKAYLIGKDNLSIVFKPTNERPAIYWRLLETKPCSFINDTYSCSWFTAVLKAHLFSSEYENRIILAKAMIQKLTLKRRLIFDDNSPLMLDNIKLDSGINVLKEGQVSVEATYGILNIRPQKEKLKKLYLKGCL